MCNEGHVLFPQGIKLTIFYRF